MAKSDFNLYTADGWLNIDGISTLPGFWMAVIVGPRQVGKTFGTLNLVLNQHEPFFYMRRTVEELELIESDDSLNPFIPLEEKGHHVNLFKSGKLWQVCDWELNEEGKQVAGEWRGVATPLVQIAKMRGFNGSRYKHLVYDEFIPERGVVIKGAEGSSVLNAYTTINGNRELAGQPPLKLWLLANSNNIHNPTLEAFELIKPLEKLIRSKKEYTYLKNGIFIGYPRSEKIMEKRKQTALLNWLSDTNQFKRMAVNNEFSYDNLTVVKDKPLTGMVPYIAVDDLNFYYTKDKTHYYCSFVPHTRHPRLGIDDKSMYRISTEFMDIKLMYEAGYMTFDSISALLKYQKIFKIKETS